MSIAAFDTLTYARRLKEAGVDETQAEAHAEAVRDAVTEGVATKDDLDRGLAAVKADVTRLEDKIDNLEGKIGNLEDKIDNKADKADLYRALWIQTGAIVGTVVAAVVALGKLLS